MSASTARAQELRREAQGHKRAVRHHRERLRAVMEELAQIERVNTALGIETIVTHGVEENTHGQATDRPLNRG